MKCYLVQLQWNNKFFSVSSCLDICTAVYQHPPRFLPGLSFVKWSCQLPVKLSSPGTGSLINSYFPLIRIPRSFRNTDNAQSDQYTGVGCDHQEWHRGQFCNEADVPTEVGPSNALVYQLMAILPM